MRLSFCSFTEASGDLPVAPSYGATSRRELSIKLEQLAVRCMRLPANRSV
jgi:hypothetical protein